MADKKRDQTFARIESEISNAVLIRNFSSIVSLSLSFSRDFFYPSKNAIRSTQQKTNATKAEPEEYRGGGGGGNRRRYSLFRSHANRKKNKNFDVLSVIRIDRIIRDEEIIVKKSFDDASEREKTRFRYRYRYWHRALHRDCPFF